MSYKESDRRYIQWVILKDQAFADLLISHDGFKLPAICGEYDERLFVASFTDAKDGMRFIKAVEDYFYSNKVPLNCVMLTKYHRLSDWYESQIWIE